MLEHTTTNRTVIYFHPSASLCQVPFSFLPTSRQLHVWWRNFQTNQLLLLKQHKAPLVVLFLMTEKQKCPKINGIPSRSFGSMWMNDGRKNRCHWCVFFLFELSTQQHRPQNSLSHSAWLISWNSRNILQTVKCSCHNSFMGHHSSIAWLQCNSTSHWCFQNQTLIQDSEESRMMIIMGKANQTKPVTVSDWSADLSGTRWKLPTTKKRCSNKD